MPAPAVPVTDLDDPRVAPFRALGERELRTHGDAEARGWFMCEGKFVFERLLESRFRTLAVLVETQRLAELAPLLERLPADTPVYAVSRELHQRISGAHFHQGLLALGEAGPAPLWETCVADADRVVVLEGLVNHDNLGAVFRNVAALCGPRGAVLLDPRSVDPLYRKSIRVSLGWVLHVPFARMSDWPAGLARLGAAGFRTIALTPSEGAVDIARAAAMRYPKVALLVGAEAPGLTPAALAAADMRVRIPIASGVDSLNLAAATAIALHRFAPGTE